MQFSFRISSTLLLLSTPITSFMIAPYAATGCNGPAQESKVTTPAYGCRQEGVGNQHSIEIKGDWSDATYYTVFFTGDDCNPDDMIDFFDTGCLTVNYKSFEVWNMCDGDDNARDCMDV